MVKLVLRLSGNLIYHIFFIKIPDKLHKFDMLWRQHNFPSGKSWPQSFTEHTSVVGWKPFLMGLSIFVSCRRHCLSKSI